MARERLLIKWLEIQRKEQAVYFRIRLPHDVIKITGVETDAIILTHIEPPAQSSSPYPTGSIVTEWGYITPEGVEVRWGEGGAPPAPGPERTPFLKWNSAQNFTLGYLRLKGYARQNLLHAQWIRLSRYNSGMPDMSFGNFPHPPFSLHNLATPRTLCTVPSSTTVEGCFIDQLGKQRSADTSYRVMIALHVETREASDKRASEAGTVELECKT